MSNESTPGIAARWTAPALVGLLTLVMYFVWDRVHIGAQLEDCIVRIGQLEKAVDKLATKETLSRDEQIIDKNSKDIEGIKVEQESARKH